MATPEVAQRRLPDAETNPGATRQLLNRPMGKRLVHLVVFVTALTATDFSAAAELDVVRFDLQSGTIAGTLPFDVPFLMTSQAPPGSVTVEAQIDEKNSIDDTFGGRWQPEAPIVSTVSRDGTFRIRFPALEPNRYFRFRFTLERRLTSSQSLELRRQLEPILARHLDSVSEDGVGPTGATALHEAIRDALERVLNDGLPIATRGDTIEMDAPDGSLFHESMMPSDVRNLVDSLIASFLMRHSERVAALRLYQETVPSFEAELTAVNSSDALAALLSALQRAPDLDPRNPRNELHLPDDAAHLADLSSAEALAVARGQSQSERPVDLTDTFSSDDADRFRARYLRTARSLRSLREWLEAVVTPGSRYRALIVERLVEPGAVSLQQLDRLRVLADSSNGAIRLAERWAETLEIYVYDLQRALMARQREVASLVAEIDAQAAATILRQTSVSDVLSTEANLYVGLDLGVLYAFEVERAAAYVGADVYFGPVNKKASLRDRGGFKKRFSVTVGITLTDLGLEDDPRIEPLLGGGSNLVLGAGFRLARSMRIGGGTLMVLKNDPNPLVTDRSLAFTPYASFSFDVDLVGALRTLTR